MTATYQKDGVLLCTHCGQPCWEDLNTMCLGEEVRLFEKSQQGDPDATEKLACLFDRLRSNWSHHPSQSEFYRQIAAEKHHLARVQRYDLDLLNDPLSSPT